MTTIKSYTDIEQSRKLAEFLPLESADGFWEYHDKWYSEGDEWEGKEIREVNPSLFLFTAGIFKLGRLNTL